MMSSGGCECLACLAGAGLRGATDDPLYCGVGGGSEGPGDALNRSKTMRIRLIRASFTPVEARMGLFQSVPFMWRGAAGRAERLPERGTVHPSAPRELLGGLAISLSHSDTLRFTIQGQKKLGEAVSEPI